MRLGLIDSVRVFIGDLLISTGKELKPKNLPISKFIKKMSAQDYIESSRQYLDYVEDHVTNVATAFSELSDACDGKEYWVGDDYSWYTLMGEVVEHDLSKLSKEEFVPYRDYFYPVADNDKSESGFGAAWEHHKTKNPHHHETAVNYSDLVHMVIDWMAMSYKFKDCPRKFYEKVKPSMGDHITKDHHEFISRQFDHPEEYRDICRRKSSWKGIFR